jgi:hypothetical protein
MPVAIESLAPDLAAAAKRLTSDLQRAAGKNLAGLILHGCPAAGRHRSRNRVLKVVVLLHHASAKGLAAIEPVIRNPWKAIPIEVSVLMPEEVVHWKEEFAIKFHEIRNRYVVLAGTDPFADIKLSWPHVRQQVVVNLRKLLLRLRCDRVELGGDGPRLASSLARIVCPFARQLMFLLQLLGYAFPTDDRPAIVFYAAAPVVGLNYKMLMRLLKVRRSRPTAKSVAGLHEKVLAALARAADFAAQMRDPWEAPAREVHAAGEACSVNAAAT